jgi:hypothetical protein
MIAGRRNEILFYNLTVVILAFVFMLLSGCTESSEPEPQVTREESIPVDAVKMTPETDLFPPVLHSGEYENPVPVDTPINTAGGEDSPFIPADRDELYLFFTPDVAIPAEQQLTDKVTGIYVSQYKDGVWQEPERVLLQTPGKLALDGCEYVQGNEMLFASYREGYTGPHWFSAEYINGEWTNWQLADFNDDYEVGELHIYEDELYYHSYKTGGKGKYDIWMLTLTEGEWQNPVNVESVNSEEDDGWPYVTPDGNELWFTRTYMGTPAVFRLKRIEREWQEPELIISQFAGEPTLDKNGNVYFVHHFYENGQMIEADIYVAYRK